jgi:hypothetical protein
LGRVIGGGGGGRGEYIECAGVVGREDCGVGGEEGVDLGLLGLILGLGWGGMDGGGGRSGGCGGYEFPGAAGEVAVWEMDGVGGVGCGGSDGLI